MKHFHVVLSIAALAAFAMLLVTRPWDHGAAPAARQADAPAPVNSAQSIPVEQVSTNRKRIPTKPVDVFRVPRTETVMGIKMRRDRSCTLTRHYLELGDGTVSEAISCEGRGSPPSDYDHYDDRTLKQLAYGDAEAASVLGKRLVEADPARSRALVLRALALRPHDIEPAMWLASQAYSLRGNSVAARRATANSYILTRIAQELGGEVAVTWIIEDAKESGFDDADFASLESRVAEDLQRIGDIQLEVFGERTLREDLP